MPIIKKYDKLMPPGPPVFIIEKEKFTPPPQLTAQPNEQYKETSS